MDNELKRIGSKTINNHNGKEVSNEEINALAGELVLNHQDNPMFARGNRTSIKFRVTGRLDTLTRAEMRAQMAVLWKDPANYNIDTIAEMVSDHFGLEGENRLTARAVRYAIKGLIQYWKNVGVLAVDDKMAMVMARYAQIEALAEDAYFRSLENKEVDHIKKQIRKAHSKLREKWIAEEIAKQRKKMRESGQDTLQLQNDELENALIVTEENIESYQRTEEGRGDAKMLQIMMQVNDRRASIWNLKEHNKVNNDNQGIAALSDDERDKRLAAVLTRAANRRDEMLGIETNLAEPQPLGGHQEIEITTTFDESDLEGLEFI